MTNNADRKTIKPTRFEERPSFTLAGVATVTTNAAELSGAGKIGKLYEQYYSQNIGERLAPQQLQSGSYGCYFNYEDGVAGKYEVMVGVHVRDDLQTPYPDQVSTFTVPSAKYAVFVTERGPIIEMVQRAWADIWKWAEESGNERAYTGDFEYYAPNINPNDGEVEIYIAVRE
ncbi:GyrI-like domain-containing protein [Cohnella soli]|uniref:GyrI-like domain-containing protein n=1 Tax=Cohnella soli TaxID=425005 RepID=A0ABW0HWW5_9BACL